MNKEKKRGEKQGKEISKLQERDVNKKKKQKKKRK